MAPILPARDLRAGHWILGPDSKWPVEVASVAACTRMEDPYTGRLVMVHRRVRLTNGRVVEFNADTLVPTY